MPGLLDFFADPDAQEQMRQRALALAQQGARGVTTGLLGAPVDIANMAMANVGGDKPVMGSGWIGDKLQSYGLLAPPPKDIGESGAEFLGGLVNPPSGLLGGAGKALIAFHGSPHLFDKFDMSKIGTGEGAQAYGHGLYFAENPNVAKMYQTTLAPNAPTWRYVDRKGTEFIPDWIGNDDLQKAESYLYNTFGKTDFSHVNDAVIASAPKQVVDGLRLIKDKGLSREFYKDTGTFYKVDIPDEAIPKMLDWDKGFSGQSKEVQDALRKLWVMRGGSPDTVAPWTSHDGATGESIHAAIATAFNRKVGDNAASQAAAAVSLRNVGIPGIRYLDAGSRAKGGTSNFVLFDDALPKILSRE